MQPSEMQLLSEAFLTNLRSYIKIKQKLWQLSLHLVENLGGFLSCSDSGRNFICVEPEAMDKTRQKLCRLLKESKRKCMEKTSVCLIAYGEMKHKTCPYVQIALKWDGY